MRRQRRDQPDQSRDILEFSFDGIYQIKSSGIVSLWNKSAERITGYPAESILGSNCQNNPIRHSRENGREFIGYDLPMIATLVDGQPRELHVFISHSEGYRVSVMIRTVAIFDTFGKIIGASEIINDNKTLIAAHLRSRQVEHTITFDDLTKIGSRIHIENKIKLALVDYKITGIPFGMLFVDIDHFKEFNDLHGHLTGDKVLRFVANAIKNHLRVTDSCGRWGGDEFLALVLDIKAGSLALVAEKLRQVIERSGIKVEGQNLNITISIGACMVKDGDTLESLIQRADSLMYKSKQNGRNRVTFEG